MGPTQEQLREAFKAGFQSIDDGDGFYPGFDAYLKISGYVKLEDIPCTCPDSGDHGHLPECRWITV